MKLHTLSLVVTATLILSACGGGGSGTTTTNPVTDAPPPQSSAPAVSSSQATTSQSSLSQNSTSQSSITATGNNLSASSASTAPATTSSSASSSSMSSQSSSVQSSVASSSQNSSGCASIEGNIFIDCVDPAWKNIIGFEQKKDYSIQGEVTDGTQGQMVTWQISPSHDQNHNNVIEVQFKDNNDYNASVHLSPNTPSGDSDMSAFATGKLVFDIKLTNAGNFNPDLVALLECTYPCVGHEHFFTISALNHWQTVEIPIAEFIDGGLDITKVSAGFLIMPAWNKQNNVQFQLDNIRWVKGQGSAPHSAANCYEQRFETWGLGVHMDVMNGLASVANGALRQTIARTDMFPTWATTTDKFGYVPSADSTFSPCAFTNGSLSVQVSLDKNYITDGKLRVGLYYEDILEHKAYFPSFSAAGFVANTWKTLSVPLVASNNTPAFSSVDSAFDISRVTNVGVYVDANGKSPFIDGIIQVDNIFISGTPVTPNVANSSSSSHAASSAASSNQVASSSSSSQCNPSVQALSDSVMLGFGLAQGSIAYIRVNISNATFDQAPSLSGPNISGPILNSSNYAIFSLTAPSGGAPQNTILQFSYSYVVINAGNGASATYGVYDSITNAVNQYLPLSGSSSTLPTGCGH